MPWSELALRTVAALAGVTLLLVLYTHALLLIGRCFGGVAKVAASLVLYLVVAAALGGGLLFVLGAASDVAVRQSWSYVGAVLAAWALMAAPGILYLRNHLPMLRSMGFFRAR